MYITVHRYLQHNMQCNKGCNAHRCARIASTEQAYNPTYNKMESNLEIFSYVYYEIPCFRAHYECSWHACLVLAERSNY